MSDQEHNITVEAERMSGIQKATCSCGWFWESNNFARSREMAEEHAASRLAPTREVEEAIEDQPCEWNGKMLGRHDWIDIPGGWVRCTKCKREYKPIILEQQAEGQSTEEIPHRVQVALPELNIDAEIAGQSVAIMESPDYEWQEGDFLRRALCRERQLLQALRDLAAAREQIARLEAENAQAFNDGVEAAAKWHREEGRKLNGSTPMLDRAGYADAARRHEKRAYEHFRDAEGIVALKRPTPPQEGEQHG